MANTDFQLLPSDDLAVIRRQATRDLLVAFKEQNASYAQLAQSFGIPIGTVKSRLNRARKYILRNRKAAS